MFGIAFLNFRGTPCSKIMGIKQCVVAGWALATIMQTHVESEEKKDRQLPSYLTI